MSSKVTLLATSVLLLFLSGCSNVSSPVGEIIQSENQASEQHVDDGASESAHGVLISDEDNVLFQSLKDEREFVTSFAYQQILRSSWQFARAALSGDHDTMYRLGAPDLDVDVTMNIFDNGLEFLVLKGVRQEEDSVWLSYEFSETGSDSFSYLTIEMISVNGNYLVSFYGLEP